MAYRPICTHKARHSVLFLIRAAKICKYHFQLSVRNPRLSPAGWLTGWLAGRLRVEEEEEGGGMLTEVSQPGGLRRPRRLHEFSRSSRDRYAKLYSPSLSLSLRIFRPPSSRVPGEKGAGKMRGKKIPHPVVICAYTIAVAVNKTAYEVELVTAAAAATVAA